MAQADDYANIDRYGSDQDMLPRVMAYLQRELFAAWMRENAVLRAMRILHEAASSEDVSTKKKPEFYHCGICEQYHSIKWDGDCRQDAARFNPEDLDAKYGFGGWEEVDMPGSDL